ncbi:MAG: MBL fold metallo-hydrolase [Deltaproteobacteria bacterium]|nr:MBL fold metallo-hydrolase [Deltaproteobacteria bacterium]
MTPLRTITLCENTAQFGFLAEWGLSIFIEAHGRRLLLDTGMTDVAVRNASHFNINFSDLDAIVLSHGHSDHTGGLTHVLDQSGPKPVIAHPDIFKTRFTVKHRPEVRDITLPHSRELLESRGAQFQLDTAYREIFPGIAVSGEVPMETDFEFVEKSLQTGTRHELRPDPLHDDLSLAIQTGMGLFIITGCAHRGIVNIVRHFQKMTGEKTVYAIMGGFHLGNASPAHINKVISFLIDTGVKKLMSAHCTGFNASCAMFNAFGKVFLLNQSGTRFVFNVDPP